MTDQDKLLKLLEDPDVQKSLEQFGKGLKSSVDTDMMGKMGQLTSNFISAGPILGVFQMVFAKLRASTSKTTIDLAQDIIDFSETEAFKTGLDIFEAMVKQTTFNIKVFLDAVQWLLPDAKPEFSTEQWENIFSYLINTYNTIRNFRDPAGAIANWWEGSSLKQTWNSVRDKWGLLYKNAITTMWQEETLREQEASLL